MFFLFLPSFDSSTLDFGCFEVGALLGGLIGPVFRKSESLKPELGAEVARPMEEAKEATSDFRRSSSCVVGSGFLDFEIAIVVVSYDFKELQLQWWLEIGRAHV